MPKPWWKTPSPMQRIQAERRRLGTRGEAIAARVLAELGIECLCRNYRYKRDEIDLVCREGTTLCFVEVKTRGRRGWHRPAEAVTWQKRRNLMRAARGYLRSLGRPRLDCRFDIVEVIFEQGRLSEVQYYPNAWVARGGGVGRPVPGSSRHSHSEYAR